VQFLKSLFCLQGFDNRTRFFSICSATYVIFIMLSSAFTGKVFISLIVLVLFTPLLVFTSLRRIKDGKINKKWLIVPNVLFVLMTFIIIFSKQGNYYYLLLIPAFFSSILLTYPSINKVNSASLKYIFGYFGPVDMTEYQQTTYKNNTKSYRIEPSVTSNNSENFRTENYHTENVNTENYNSNNLINDDKLAYQNHENKEQPSNKNQRDLGELIRLKLLNNRKAQLTVAIILTVVFFSICASWLMSYFQSDTLSKEESIELTTSTHNQLNRNYPLPMPDNFSLFLTQHRGVIINWQADEVSNPILWSQSIATGDKSCQQISFNKGNPIRTLMVQVESNPTVNSGILNNYFAIFSPLDSKVLIQALAFRGGFSLCGYDFSLKGSQAALSKNKQYADWVSY
jgi:hypothetical protein